MEPERRTEDHLQPVLAELVALEPLFHHPELGTTREAFARQMAPEFWETGASGRRYSRDFTLDTLVARYADGEYDDVWETSDFQCVELGPETYLVTYTLVQDGSRVTRRATIWRRAPEGWQVVYHQGTLVED
ncbi:MAG TPA: DUF4440 domain-containing protein [Mycobacteriales bacterium]|jgi:hypothetical protein